MEVLHKNLPRGNDRAAASDWAGVLSTSLGALAIHISSYFRMLLHAFLVWAIILYNSIDLMSLDSGEIDAW